MMNVLKTLKKANKKKQPLIKPKSESSINLSGDLPTSMPLFKKEESLDLLDGIFVTNSMTLI
jgi:hypothetical protein